MDKNSLAVEVFNRNANNYQQAFMDVSGYSEGFDFVLSKLYPESFVLDLASGPGNVAKYFLERNDSLNYSGSDLSPEMVKLARQNCPTATFSVGDCRKVDWKQSYDAILMSFIFPYLDQNEVSELLKSARKHLSTNGIIYISTMEGSAEMSGLQTSPSGNRLYMYYYEQPNLDALFQELGLEIAFFKRQAFQHPNGTEFTDLIYILKNC